MEDKEFEELIVGLLRLKRTLSDPEYIEFIHSIQRKMEEEYGEYGVVLAGEYSCESGWEPDT